MNAMELLLTLFQAEYPLTLFLHEHLKKMIISLMYCFVCPGVLESVSSTKKLMMTIFQTRRIFYQMEVLL